MNPSQPTIFIQIAAYRDPDLPATLHNLLSRAAAPQRIHLGICLQLASADPEAWGNNHLPEHPHLQLHNCLANESRGTCWARRQAQQFFQGVSSYRFKRLIRLAENVVISVHLSDS